MRVFIAHSFSERNEQEKVLECIENTVGAFGGEAFSFVKSYPPYKAGDEMTMMRDAFQELSCSDILIAEGSDKAIGVGIEAGFARAKNIPVIYIHTASSDTSKTLKGCATITISYADTEDLGRKLRVALSTV